MLVVSPIKGAKKKKKKVKQDTHASQDWHADRQFAFSLECLLKTYELFQMLDELYFEKAVSHCSKTGMLLTENSQDPIYKCTVGERGRH